MSPSTSIPILLSMTSTSLASSTRVLRQLLTMTATIVTTWNPLSTRSSRPSASMRFLKSYKSALMNLLKTTNSTSLSGLSTESKSQTWMMSIRRPKSCLSHTCLWFKWHLRSICRNGWRQCSRVGMTPWALVKVNSRTRLSVMGLRTTNSPWRPGRTTIICLWREQSKV